MARELKATVRSETGRHAAERLRRQNLVPGVIYREGKPGTNLSLDESEWTKVLSSGQRDVTLPAELHAIDDPNLVVCSVHEPRHEEVAVAPVEGAPTEPEVITAKKEEAPAEGAAAAAAGGPPPKGEAKKEEKKK